MSKDNNEKLKTVLLPIEESLHTRIKILIATKKTTMRNWAYSKILEGLVIDEKKLKVIASAHKGNNDDRTHHDE